MNFLAVTGKAAQCLSMAAVEIWMFCSCGPFDVDGLVEKLMEVEVEPLLRLLLDVMMMLLF
jgi:hypothetical protein